MLCLQDSFNITLEIVNRLRNRFRGELPYYKTRQKPVTSEQ